MGIQASNPLLFGSFALDSFTSNSITFKGTTNSYFDAYGGKDYSFDVSQEQAVPEPVVLSLFGLGLVVIRLTRRTFA